MEDFTVELKKLEKELKEAETSCAEELLGHPYNKNIYKDCGAKIEALKNEMDTLENEEIKKRAKELGEEINRLREERERQKKQS
jgi:uncharacterized small protein (DUF1192 family)